MRLVVSNEPEDKPAGVKAMPATVESELDPKNPNRRAMILVGGVESVQCPEITVRNRT